MSCMCTVPADRVKDKRLLCVEPVRAAKLSERECLESCCVILTSKRGDSLS